MTDTNSSWGSLDDDSIRAIRSAIRDGITDGIRTAAEDQQLMRALVDHIIVAARDEVASQSGRWLWTGLGGFLSRLAWWLLIASAILTAGGGWAGVIAFFKAGPK